MDGRWIEDDWEMSAGMAEGAKFQGCGLNNRPLFLL
jgi:hypothetical protein